MGNSTEESKPEAKGEDNNHWLRRGLPFAPTGYVEKYTEANNEKHMEILSNTKNQNPLVILNRFLFLITIANFVEHKVPQMMGCVIVVSQQIIVIIILS